MATKDAVPTIDIDDLLKGEREGAVEVELGGESRTIRFAWNPNAYTAGRQREFAAWLEKDGSDPGYLLIGLLALLTKWDLHRAGQPLGITPDALERLPVAWLTAMLGHIMEADRPNPTTGSGSTAGSGSEETPAAHLDGSPTSAEQEPSAPHPGSSPD